MARGSSGVAPGGSGSLGDCSGVARSGSGMAPRWLGGVQGG